MKLIEAAKVNCLECGTLLRGRTDKKFCSDSCRNAFHNRENRYKNNLIRNVHNRLRKNYRILKTLPHEKLGTPLPKALLANQGFDFNSITRLHPKESGKADFWIYDIGYTPVDETRIMIIQEEIEIALGE